MLEMIGKAAQKIGKTAAKLGRNKKVQEIASVVVGAVLIHIGKKVGDWGNWRRK
jgi:hypothetical protein